MKGRCEADGTQDVLYVHYTSADSDDVFSRLVLRGKKKKSRSDGKRLRLRRNNRGKEGCLRDATKKRTTQK